MCGSGVESNVRGTGEKWVYDAPEKRYSGLMEGAMKTSETGASRATSSSICESAILITVAGVDGCRSRFKTTRRGPKETRLAGIFKRTPPNPNNLGLAASAGSKGSHQMTLPNDKARLIKGIV